MAPLLVILRYTELSWPNGFLSPTHPTITLVTKAYHANCHATDINQLMVVPFITIALVFAPIIMFINITLAVTAIIMFKWSSLPLTTCRS